MNSFQKLTHHTAKSRRYAQSIRCVYLAPAFFRWQEFFDETTSRVGETVFSRKYMLEYDRVFYEKSTWEATLTSLPHLTVTEGSKTLAGTSESLRYRRLRLRGPSLSRDFSKRSDIGWFSRDIRLAEGSVYSESASGNKKTAPWRGLGEVNKVFNNYNGATAGLEHYCFTITYKNES